MRLGRVGCLCGVIAVGVFGPATLVQAKGIAYIAGATSIDAERIAANGSISPAAPALPTGAIGAARGVAVTPDAKHVFVAGFNAVAAFNAAADGTLTAVAGSPFPAGATDGRGLAITPDGKFLYATFGNGGAGKIARFVINSDGTITSPVLTGRSIRRREWRSVLTATTCSPAARWWPR